MDIFFESIRSSSFYRHKQHTAKEGNTSSNNPNTDTQASTIFARPHCVFLLLLFHFFRWYGCLVRCYDCRWPLFSILCVYVCFAIYSSALSRPSAFGTPNSLRPLTLHFPLALLALCLPQSFSRVSIFEWCACCCSSLAKTNSNSACSIWNAVSPVAHKLPFIAAYHNQCENRQTQQRKK